MEPQALQDALHALPNASPGPDGITKTDLQIAGSPVLGKLQHAVVSETYCPQRGYVHKYAKKDGGTRTVYVANMLDRVLMRSLADVLSPAVDRILSPSAYAYRSGQNRQAATAAVQKALRDGYVIGLRTDIQSFFESVQRSKLVDLLKSLFPFDTLPEFIDSWLQQMESLEIRGLPQGCPLSPTLSNLYLDRFDKEIRQAGFFLARYGDDFVVLAGDSTPVDEVVQTVSSAVQRVGLQLNHEKSISLHPAETVHFLGYAISSEKVQEIRIDKEKEQPWHRILTRPYLKGRPVYLTTLVRHAFSRGANLVVRFDEDREEQIPWNSVSRIVIVGRSSFSGGVIYRAVRENISVSFIDLMGVTRGHLWPETYELPSYQELQRSCASRPQFRLMLMREILSAKIHNASVILRRNKVETAEFKSLSEKALTATDAEQLRGLEGRAGALYFDALRKLVDPFPFEGRAYRPPPDPVNAMLSFAYTLLYNRMVSALRAKGLDCRIGFMHQPKGRHQVLASDLMEELRHVADRVVLALIHRRQIRTEHFTTAHRRGVETYRLNGEGFRIFIRWFEKTLATPFRYNTGEPLNTLTYMDTMAERIIVCMKLDTPYTAMRIR